MHLENVVFDSTAPQALGRFWEMALGTETLTDEPEGYETRLSVPEGPVLDLCFQLVAESSPGQRLRLDLHGGEEPKSAVERLLALGASPADIGDEAVPWVALIDLENNPFRVMQQDAAHVDAGPVAALGLDVADPGRDRDFWMWLTGWVPVDGAAGLPGLRHASHHGPVLELRPEAEPKGPGKNRMHLDIRLEADDDADAVAREITDRGGRELNPDWGVLPWRVFTDPSGNEFCVLPASPG